MYIQFMNSVKYLLVLKLESGVRKEVSMSVLVTGNARSLNNKIDELEACTRYMHEYRDASLLCFSESWFKSNTPDSTVSLDGYHLGVIIKGGSLSLCPFATKLKQEGGA